MSDHNPEQRVQSGAVDTHCHLFLLGDDPSAPIETARRVGVETLICPGIDPISSRHAVELAESYSGVLATAGMHPHDASAFDEGARAAIEDLLGHPRVVAVGECGLDFFRMRSPRQDQERVLRVHIDLARAAGLPLVIHTREAWPTMLQLLDEGSAERVVLHCFTGDTEVALECASRGYHLSFAGNVKYPRNEELRAVAAALPLDRVLVETDSPFLPPQRLRGRENEPANVLDVIDELARIRGEPADVVRGAATANAGEAFPRLRSALGPGLPRVENRAQESPGSSLQ
jgi:TatD DNase family protein